MKAIAVIPARDAEATVGEVVRGLKRAIPDLPVLVVDDGSADQTALKAREAGADVIRRDVNGGKGAALQTGFDEALRRGADGVLALDADRQHDPAYAPRLLAALDRADLVIGSREGDRTGMPWLRRATNTVTTWFVSRLAGQRIEDSQSGYRAIRARVLRAVRPRSTRFEYESEFLIAAARQDFRITAIPVPTLYNAPRSHIHPIADTIRFIRLLFRHWAR
ncbi:MAG: glycosyltransferase family 2 protein [Candidatus Latescibacteria bacterium]|nr:glycosyltransferase family 2 protein [Candidatus Latescibacterota bacterium]